MAAERAGEQPKVIFVPPMDDDEHKEWLLSLAGDDPARRNAVLYWLTINGLDIFDRHQDRIVELHFEDANIEPKDLRALTLFPELENLVFKDTPLSQGVLQVIGQHQTLLEMRISGDATLNDGVFALSAQLPELRCLEVSDAAITGAGLKHLAGHPRMTALTVARSKLSADGLVHIADIRNLQYLLLPDNPSLGDEGLKQVAKLQNLIWLDLSNTAVTDDGVAHLRTLKLRVISLNGASVTDRSAEVIAAMDRMTRVELQGTKITNEAVRLLAPLPKLGDALDLRDTAIDDGCVPYFGQMVHHPSIDLRGTKISKDGMERIRALLPPKAALKNDYGCR